MTAQTAMDLVKACYSTWSTTYYQDYYSRQAGYPPVHRDLIIHLLREMGARNVLDAGCGPASFLRELAGAEMDLYGFDLTPEMVTEAKRVFESLGLPPEHIWEGSVLSPASFRNQAGSIPERFDATVCIGVLPHVPPEADVEVIRNLRDAVRDGGLVIAEARNQLFALFTLNRFSFDFFSQELIRAEHLLARANGAKDNLTNALRGIQQQFRMDLPPARKGKADEPGYDEIVSRAHNPFVLREQFAAAGLRDIQILFFHYHCLPPMCQAEIPELFHDASLAQEDPYDWRGHFMASAFLIAGRRA